MVSAATMDLSLRGLVLTVLSLLQTSSTAAFPTTGSFLHHHNTRDYSSNETDLLYPHGAPVEGRAAQDFYLRILPLGGSITAGWGSSAGNGYRKYLRDQLRKDGWKVNYVGTKTGATNAPVTGTAMADNSVEAQAGFRVDEIEGLLRESLKFQPNLVLVNAGVNDCTQDYDVAGIGARMGALLDTLYGSVAGATAVLSTLIPSLDAAAAACHATVNAQYRDLVAARRARGDKIVLAEMDPGGTYWNTALDGDYYDATHPNDAGHAKMAAIWYQALGSSSASGLVTAPAATEYADDGSGDDEANTCTKTYAAASDAARTQTQSGSGWDDGVYAHQSTYRDVRLSLGGLDGSGAQTFWLARVAARDGLDDIIRYREDTVGGARKYALYRSTGPGAWSATAEEFTVPDACVARGVRWADMNGDGLDDFVCIAPNGDAVLSVNRGGLQFENLGIDKKNEGVLQAYIRLGDIDGDGRTDYCTLNDAGDLRCWRNGGISDLSTNWQDLGVVFSKNLGDIEGIRLVDINGDGRSDWLWMDDTGKTWTYTNNRGCDKGAEGDHGLAPTWRAGQNAQTGAGATHAGLGVAGARATIHFARAYGTVPAFGLLPARDYVRIKQTSSSSSAYAVEVWQNVGGGGARLKGDGARYCNMLGRASGRQDYVWVFSNGRMHVWEALDAFPAQPRFWGADYDFFDQVAAAGRSMDRRDLHLVDWDGDGACDVVYTDPARAGALEVWRNTVKTSGALAFEYIGNPAPAVSCDQARGTGIMDLAVRLADITGNGLPDYLCMEKDGRTKGFVHESDGSFTSIAQIKQSDGYDRANFRHADVDGDGLADLIWTDKFKGDAVVWKNMGRVAAAGTASSFTWANQGTLYGGPAQGSCLQFPDLDGNGRADLVYVDALENWAYTWFNTCPDNSSGDDADTFTSAPLPAAPS